jgi:cyclohexanecarboxylate-CoA ligase
MHIPRTGSGAASPGRPVSADVDPELISAYLARGWWRDRTIIDDLYDHAARQPHKLAVVSHRAGRTPATFSFAELAATVDTYAAGLLDLGVRPGEVISIQLPNWWQLTALHLACGRIGAVTNAILPILRRREVTFICERLNSHVLVTPHTFRGHDYANTAAEVARAVPGLEAVFAMDADDPAALPDGVRPFEAYFDDPVHRAAHPPAELDRLRPDPNQVAQVQFTSGTTGEPKGVVHTWNTVYAGMRPSVEALGLGPDDVVLAFSPMAHTVGFYYGITMPTCYGQTAVLQDVWDAAAALELVHRYSVTWTMAATPFVFDLCAAAGRDGAHASLARISSAGAPIPPALVDRVQTSLHARLFSVWGMTEVGAVTSTLASDPPARAATTDGRAMAWNELAILDDRGRELPRGTLGRLVVKGASLLVAYHRRPDLFQRSFTGDGWFDTGDLATMDDEGYIRLAGRTKDLIIRGGENIPVVEVEGLLLEHAKVAQIAMVGVPDERLGERAAAVIVPADPDDPPILAELTSFLEARGMARHFWPECLVIVDELPRTAAGKIQKFRVRNLAEAAANTSSANASPAPGEQRAAARSEP